MTMTVGALRGKISAEINVVPLIDILLVLLVIFMSVAHSQKGLHAVIPQPATAESPAAVVVIQILGDGSLRINQEPVGWEMFEAQLEQVFKVRADRTAFVRADEALDFQVVARAIDVMRTAGASTVGLLTGKLEYAR